MLYFILVVATVSEHISSLLVFDHRYILRQISHAQGLKTVLAKGNGGLDAYSNEARDDDITIESMARDLLLLLQ
jgi:hypothetical protein